MNRSEELAKLLGIEPKEQYVTKHCMQPLSLNDDVTTYNERTEIYPDFTKPSNFVKLLENYFKYWNIHIRTNNGEDFRNVLIDLIIRELASSEKFQNDCQQTEWTY